MKCILCDGAAKIFFTDSKNYHEYLRCENCDLIFLHPQFRLNNKSEYERYKQHENTVENPEYLNFVRPLHDKIVLECKTKSLGLDYGCGAVPVLSHALSKSGYEIVSYDPFFYPSEDYLQKKYDFIFAIEVVEHFFNPKEEFLKLKNILKAGGAFGIMTSLVTADIQFESWYYRRDSTHVCFYSHRCFDWICKHMEFSSCEFIDKQTIWINF